MHDKILSRKVSIKRVSPYNYALTPSADPEYAVDH